MDSVGWIRLMCRRAPYRVFSHTSTPHGSYVKFGMKGMEWLCQVWGATQNHPHTHEPSHSHTDTVKHNHTFTYSLPHALQAHERLSCSMYDRGLSRSHHQASWCFDSASQTLVSNCICANACMRCGGPATRTSANSHTPPVRSNPSIELSALQNCRALQSSLDCGFTSKLLYT